MTTKTMSTSALSIHPLSPALGAEIRCVDVTQDIPDFDSILAAWHDHLVLLFRGQTLSPDEQVSFAGRFGPVEPRRRLPRSEAQQAERIEGRSGHPDVMLVSNIRENGKLIGSLPDGEMEFHSDTCYRETPAGGAFLYAVEIPKVGGDTMFLNLYKAYETLPEELKRRIAGRQALNVYSYGSMSRADQLADLTKSPHFAHPIVRTHPATGRKALNINRLMSLRIEDMEERESRSLLDALFDHIEQQQFIYTHHWRPGDLLLWDNRCTLHARSDFSAEERRLLRRVSLAGERPYEVLPA